MKNWSQFLSSKYLNSPLIEMAKSLLSRKLDLFYFIFHAVALPLIFLVDLQTIYPPSFVPAFVKEVRIFYIKRYNDQFFIDPPPFFKFFALSELFYQAPVMAWSLSGLYYNSPKVPLVLLPLSIVVFTTTLTCMVEYFYWEMSWMQKLNLTTLYGPYLALSAMMGLDMYARLNKTINSTLTKEKCSWVWILYFRST